MYNPPDGKGHSIQRPFYITYLCGSWHLWILAVEEYKVVGHSQIQPHYVARRKETHKYTEYLDNRSHNLLQWSTKG